MAWAYCVKDKMKVEVQDASRITMKNGKPAMVGTCPVCGGKVFKIGGGGPIGAAPDVVPICPSCHRPSGMGHRSDCTAGR
jgi:hypothetical protein